MKELRGIPISGRFLAEVRDRLALTQEELAPKINMTKGSLSRLENSTLAGMNKRSFRALAELLHVSLDELRKQLGGPHIHRLHVMHAKPPPRPKPQRQR